MVGRVTLGLRSDEEAEGGGKVSRLVELGGEEGEEMGSHAVGDVEEGTLVVEGFWGETSENAVSFTFGQKRIG